MQSTFVIERINMQGAHYDGGFSPETLAPSAEVLSNTELEAVDTEADGLTPVTDNLTQD